MLDTQDMNRPWVLAAVLDALQREFKIKRASVEADQVRVYLQDGRYALVDFPGDVVSVTDTAKEMAGVLRNRLRSLV